MTLADALRGMSERALAPYRAAAGAPPGAEITELVAHLTAAERVAQTVRGLPEGPLLGLRILWFHAAQRMQPWLFHTVFSRQGGGGGADRAITDLVDAALLVPPLSAGGQYAIPDEVRPALLRVVAEEWLPASGFYPPVEAEPRVVTGAEPAAVVADFARFLGALRAGGVRVRQQGSVPYQADQRRLVAACDTASLPALPPTHPGRVVWQGYEPTLGPLFAAAIGYGLIEARAGAWRESAQAQTWSRLPPAVAWRGLLRVWAAMSQAQAEDPLTRGIFGCIVPQRWCRPLQLARWLGHFTAAGEDALVAVVQNLTVGLGVRLGALEWGLCAPAAAGETPDLAVRLRPEAASALGEPPVDADLPAFDEAPLVQGTFEVLAGPRTPTPTLWLLESWAERVALDRFATYRLTRRSVSAAAQRGEAVTDLLLALARSPGGVPQNVSFTVREWAGGTMRLSATLGVLLRCLDGETAERVAATAALRHCERLGPTTWLVPADDLLSVWKSLRENGCDVQGDMQELRERLRNRLDLYPQMWPPAPTLPWPGAMVLPWPSTVPQGDAATPVTAKGQAGDAVAPVTAKGQQGDAAAPVTAKGRFTAVDGGGARQPRGGASGDAATAAQSEAPRPDNVLGRVGRPAGETTKAQEAQAPRPDKVASRVGRAAGEPPKAKPAPATRPDNALGRVGRAAAAASPVRATPPVPVARRPPGRSFGDALPAVMRLTQREVRRTLERGLQAGRPVGLVDATGATHVISVRELAPDALTGHCARCGRDHRLPLREVTATFKP